MNSHKLAPVVNCGTDIVAGLWKSLFFALLK